MIPRKFRILVIDDKTDVEFTQELIGDSVSNGNCEIINLSDRDCLNSRSLRNGAYSWLSESFKDQLKNSTIDIIACDVNLWDGASDTWIHARIVDDIRRWNKTLRILSYSGDIGSQVNLAINNGAGTVPEKITKLLDILLNGCDAFSKREDVVVSLNEILARYRWDIELECVLESVYCEYLYTFRDGSKLNGGELAAKIRAGEQKGIEFMNHVTEFGIDNIQALFS